MYIAQQNVCSSMYFSYENESAFELTGSIFPTVLSFILMSRTFVVMSYRCKPMVCLLLLSTAYVILHRDRIPGATEIHYCLPRERTS